MAITVGDACPEFSLPDDRGQAVTSEQLIGRPFVLYFYPKDDTSGCTLEAVEFSKQKQEFDAAGVALFGVSPDPVKKHAKFRDKHELSVPLIADEERSLIEAFGLWVEKSMYGRTYMGVERTSVLFDKNGHAARIWNKVKVAGHAEDVLQAARSLSSEN